MMNNEVDMNNQVEHISALQDKKRAEIQKAAALINQQYIKCYEGDESAFTDLIASLDKMYKGLVRRRLQLAGCFNDENEHTAMQEAHLAIWSYIKKTRQEKRAEISFTSYCKGIYFHKVSDVVRSEYVSQKKYGGKFTSLDADALGEKRGMVGEYVESPKYGGNRSDLIIAANEQRDIFDKCFIMYCDAMTVVDATPQRKVALYYARVLPHVLQVYHNVDTIPDGKAASPKWAIKSMGKRNILMLGNESQEQMQQFIEDSLRWSENFWLQLEDEIETSIGLVHIKDIIFVDEYDEKQIGHMTDYMHKLVAKEWLKEAKREPLFLSKAIEYTTEMDRISSMLKGGQSR